MAKNKKKKKNSRPNNNQVAAQEVETKETVVEENVEVIEPDKVEEKVEAKNSKAEKEDKKAKKAKKEKKSLGARAKEVHSELKKVSWPKFSKVVKTTGVVIFVVLICMLLLFGIDMAFKYGIYDQIIG